MHGVTDTFTDYPAKVHRVIDGDTLELLVDTGFYQRIAVGVRLRDVDTAEIHNTPPQSKPHQRGQEQKAFVEQWVAQARQTDAEWPFVLDSHGEGKYGRWISTIQRVSDGRMLADDLIENFPEVEDR